jgi:hypothetical protein
MSYCNAATLRGLYSPEPLDEEAFSFMKSIPDPGFSNISITNATKEECEMWTVVFQEEINQFRRYMSNYIHERKMFAEEQQDLEKKHLIHAFLQLAQILIS